MSATAVHIPAHSHHNMVTAEYLMEVVRYKTTYNAVLPDVPGCVATSTDLNKVKDLIKEGLRLHLELMLKEGQALPEARTTSSSGDDLDDEEEFVEAAYVQVKLERPQ